eukprot:827173-Alexandrium_andersonii.AAC.1
MSLALGPERAPAVHLRLLCKDTDVCCACLQTPALQALMSACMSLRSQPAFSGDIPRAFPPELCRVPFPEDLRTRHLPEGGRRAL